MFLVVELEPTPVDGLHKMAMNLDELDTRGHGEDVVGPPEDMTREEAATSGVKEEGPDDCYSDVRVKVLVVEVLVEWVAKAELANDEPEVVRARTSAERPDVDDDEDAAVVDESGSCEKKE